MYIILKYKNVSGTLDVKWKSFNIKISLVVYFYTCTYIHLKEEALDRTLWRTRFGRGYGPVVRQTTE
jgi:hypothetical protein